MARLFAFLRGMNLGGRRVTNTELNRIFKSVGVSGVESFIASGNLIFDAPTKNAATLQARLETKLEAELGYAVPTFLRTESELKAMAAHQPFKPARQKTAATMNVGLLVEPLSAAGIKALAEHNSAADDFVVKGREVFWLCQTKMSESEFFKLPFDRRFTTSSTWRNINTLNRLVEKYLDS
ncbi:MAG: DUF1697 domain-containing protein [Gemmatimonadota bacterium]